MVKNLPANPGDTFDPQSGKIPHAMTQPSLCPQPSRLRSKPRAAVTQPHAPTPEAHARPLQPAGHSAHALQEKLLRRDQRSTEGPCPPQQGKSSLQSGEDLAQPESNELVFFNHTIDYLTECQKRFWQNLAPKHPFMIKKKRKSRKWANKEHILT